MVAALMVAVITATATPTSHVSPRPRATASPVPSSTPIPPPVIVTGCTTSTVTHTARASIGSQLLGGLLGRSSSPIGQTLAGPATTAAGQVSTASTMQIGLQNTTTREIASVRLIANGTSKIDYTTHIAPRDFDAATEPGSCNALPVVIRVEFADGTFWYPPASR